MEKTATFTEAVIILYGDSTRRREKISTWGRGTGKCVGNGYGRGPAVMGYRCAIGGWGWGDNDVYLSASAGKKYPCEITRGEATRIECESRI